MDDEKKSKAQLIAELRALRDEVDAVAGETVQHPRARLGFAASIHTFRHLLESMGAVMIGLDSKGLVLGISASVRKILGIAPEEIAGRPITRFIEPEDREHAASQLSQILSGAPVAPLVFRMRTRAGELRWFELSAIAHELPGRTTGITALARDVTAEVQALRDIDESEERHRVLSEASRDTIYETDPHGLYIYLSATSHEVLGYEPDELVGTYARELFHPDDVEPITAQFGAASAAGKQITHGDFRMRHKDGSWHWYEGTGVPFTKADGSKRVLGTLRDVSKRHEAEAEAARLRERMQVAQKLEGLGIMAGGIAHDFGNLLTPILGQAALALEDLPPGAPLRPRLEKIRAAAQRAAALTNQMLAYSGGEPLQLERIDLSKLVGEMGAILENELPDKCEIRLDLAADPPAVDADGSQLMQIVMNLITNASEALGDAGGQIAVRTGVARASAISERSLVVGQPELGTRYVYVSVTDTGHGMDAETRQRIFDPFYTTKFTGRGLGLAAVLGIVRAHDGCIELSSKPGRGTRFRVLFPARVDEAAVQVEHAPSGQPWRTNGTVLVADDDDGVCELVAETLGRCGLDVVVASDGDHALRLFEASSAPISAVVLDRTMPVLSGCEALARMRAIQPELPAVLVSGYSEAHGSPSDDLGAADAYLEKPFMPEALVRALRQAMEKGDDACDEA